MRDNLIKTFDTNPHYNANYTYDELLHLRAAGRSFPDIWIPRAKDSEARAAAESEQQKKIDADVKESEDALAAEALARDEELHTTLAEMLPKLAEAKDAARASLQPLWDARAAHNAAHQDAMVEYQKIRKFLRDNFHFDVEIDQDGKAVDGQTVAPRETRGGLTTAAVYVRGEKIAQPMARDNYA